MRQRIASGGDFDTMSPEQAKALLQGLRERGVRGVVFGGGEPLLWPHDLSGFAPRAQALGLHVQISTNGVAWPKDFERDTAIDRFILPLEADAAPRSFRVLHRPEMPHTREVAFPWFQDGLLQSGDWTEPLTFNAGGKVSAFGKKSPGMRCQTPQSRA